MRVHVCDHEGKSNGRVCELSFVFTEANSKTNFRCLVMDNTAFLIVDTGRRTWLKNDSVFLKHKMLWACSGPVTGMVVDSHTEAT